MKNEDIPLITLCGVLAYFGLEYESGIALSLCALALFILLVSKA